MSSIDIRARNKPTRDKILGALRGNPTPFTHDAAPRPAQYLPTTRLAPDEDLILRFKAELERLMGHVHLVANDEEALDKLLEIVGTAPRVMAWDAEALPLAGVGQALATHGVQLVAPRARGDGRMAAYQDLELVVVGITGAAAGFAATGTLAMVLGAGQGRLPSLLPQTHIALLRKPQIYPRLEDWLPTEGRRALAEAHASNITLITGPSRTGDIEMEIVLGVHGPGVVHVVLW
jgi:L-lactate dehydrogenase complex protein LldG